MKFNKVIKTALFSTTMAFAHSAFTADSADFNIQPGSLSDALGQYVQVTGEELLFSPSQLQGVETQGVSGSLSYEDALQLLLKGSGFSVKRPASGTQGISLVVDESGKTDARLTTGTGYDQEVVDRLPEDMVEEVLVLGSRLIADPTMTTRTMQTIGREQIESSGVSSMADLMRRLPQNINGTSTTGGGAGLGNQNLGLGANVYGGSSVNLRGLGSQYTLVLIDGRRPAGGGIFGDVVDISNIPIERVESVEILYDGAAAIYGSDAVGGVINIITRKDFSGTQLSVNYDMPEQGAGDQFNLNLGKTFNFDVGQLTVSAGYTKTESIATNQLDVEIPGIIRRALPVQRTGVVGATRDESPLMYVQDLNNDGDYDDPNERVAGGRTFEYRRDGNRFFHNIPAFNGVDQFVRDIIESDLDEATGIAARNYAMQSGEGYSPVYFANLPEYVPGQALSLYDIAYNLPANADRQAQFDALGDSLYPNSGQSITPSSEQFNASLNFSWDVLDNLRISTNADWSHSEQTSQLNAPGREQLVSSSSLTSPFGVEMNYAVDFGLAAPTNESSNDSLGVATSIEWDITEDWLLQLNGSYSAAKARSDYRNSLFETASRVSANTMTFEEFEAQYQGTLQSRLSGFGTYAFRDANGAAPEQYRVNREHEGVYFHDPLLGFNNLAEMQSALVNPFYYTETNTSNQEVELYLQGRLLTLPGGDVTTNVVVSQRRVNTEVDNTNESFNFTDILPDVNLSYLNRDVATRVNGIGGELSVPIIGADNSLPLIKNLSLHGGARIEDVNYFDEKARNWTLGLNYQPTDWATFRVNKSRSHALPSAQLMQGEGGIERASQGPLCSDSSCFGERPTPYERTLWTVSGPADGLTAEVADDLVVGLELRPFKGWRFATTYTTKQLDGQIGTPSINPGVSHVDLDDADNGRNPFITRVTAESQLNGTLLIDTPYPDPNVGGIFVPQVGDYLRDGRASNIRTTDVNTMDVSVGWTSDATRFGTFFVNWFHTRLLDHNVIQNSLCSDIVGGCSDIIDTGESNSVSLVGDLDLRLLSGGQRSFQPLPEHSGSIQVDWSYAGWRASLSSNYQSATTITRQYSFFNDEYERFDAAVAVENTPARGLNASVGYNFAESGWTNIPGWLKNTQVTLSASDLFRQDEKFEARIINDTGEEPTGDAPEGVLNTATLNPRGTTVNLRLQTVF